MGVSKASRTRARKRTFRKAFKEMNESTTKTCDDAIEAFGRLTPGRENYNIREGVKLLRNVIDQAQKTQTKIRTARAAFTKLVNYGCAYGVEHFKSEAHDLRVKFKLVNHVIENSEARSSELETSYIKSLIDEIRNFLKEVENSTPRCTRRTLSRLPDRLNVFDPSDEKSFLIIVAEAGHVATMIE